MIAPKIKSLLFICISLTSISVHAQVEKGTIFIGGRSFFNTNPVEASTPSETNKGNSTNFSIEPRAGFYLSKSFAVGLGLDYYYSSRYNSVNTLSPFVSYRRQEQSLSRLGVSMLARYNKAISKRFAFFVEGTLSTQVLSSTKTSLEETSAGVTTFGSHEVKGKFAQSVNLDIRPGVVYFVSPRFGIDATFASVYAAYSRVKPETLNGNFSSKNFVMGYNFFPAGISLGVHYYIAPKIKKLVVEEAE